MAGRVFNGYRDECKMPKNGLLNLDYKLHQRVEALGYKVGLMKGVFVFHLYRLWGDKKHLNK